MTIFQIKKIYQIIYSNNPLFFKNNFDGMSTRANLAFLEDENFLTLSNEASKFAGRDYKFYLRLHQVLWSAASASKVNGDFVELGTGRGYLFSAVSAFVSESLVKKNIYLFDTFLPFKTDKVTGEQRKGDYISSYYADSFDSMVKRFSKYDFVKLVMGRCPETLSKIYKDGNGRISFLHVDLNYHEAEIASLEYLWPYIEMGAIILLDDYANPGRNVQQIAHKKFFDSKGLAILTTGTGQGIVLVNSK